MEAFKVNVDLILLHMDHQYKGLHLHSYQMEQRGDELLLMKFKGGLFNRKLTANQYVGLHLRSFQMEQRGDEFLLMKFKGGLFDRKLTANQGYHWNTSDRALGE